MEEEFEFKPLTEGLGFHKKVVQLKNEVEESGLIRSQVATSVPSVPVIAREAKQALDSFMDPQPLKPRAQATKASTAETVNRLISTIPNLDFDDALIERNNEAPHKTSPMVHEPLPRPSAKPSQPAQAGLGSAFRSSNRSPERPPVPDDPSSIFNPLEVGMDATTAVSSVEAEIPTATPEKKSRVGNAPTRTYQETGFHPLSAFFDGLVISGLTCIFAVVLLMVTGVDLSQVLMNLSSDFPTQLGLGVLIFAVLELYIIVSRSFFGSTLGEWAFDIQLGTAEQQEQILFPLKVAWRSLVVALTGFLILPILSLIVRKDLTAKLCGLNLRQLQ